MTTKVIYEASERETTDPPNYEKNWNYFIERDPFNKQNVVEGYISLTRTDYYGALRITKVNDFPVDYDIILCTPKMHYPFTAPNPTMPTPRKMNFSKDISLIERYTKLDGTNIFAFSYADHLGRRFVSYKTRLRPFISENSVYGNFFNMWNTMLEKYNKDYFIEDTVLNMNINLSFELWGNRNPHLIRYDDVDLEATLIFGRKNNETIIPPSEILHQLSFNKPKFPMAERVALILDKYEYEYKQVQETIESELEDLGEDEYAGQEGEVWYGLLSSGNWVQLKLKPETIERIHFNSGGINRATIIAACFKAYESATLKPTVDDVINVLCEDFSKVEVNKIYYGITSRLKEVEEQYKFRKKVHEEYQKLLDVGLNVKDNKAEVMRAMSTHFNKLQMGKVYTAVTLFNK